MRKNNCLKPSGWSNLMLTILLLGVFIICLSSVSAWTTNSLNGTVTENISFLNITDIQIGPDEYNCDANINSCSAAGDYLTTAWTTYAYVNPNKQGYIYFNYTVIPSDMGSGWVTVKTRSNGNPNSIYCINYQTGQWINLGTFTDGSGSDVIDRFALNSNCLRDASPQLRLIVNLSQTGLGAGTSRYYAENITTLSSTNKTRYLLIPSSVTFITNAYMNLSGYNLSFYNIVYNKTQDIEDSVASSGTWGTACGSSPSCTYDEDWDTYSAPQPGFDTYTEETYIIATNITANYKYYQVIHKFSNFAGQDGVTVQIKKDSGSYQTLYDYDFNTWCNGPTYPVCGQITANIDASNFTGATSVTIKTILKGSQAGISPYFYESELYAYNDTVSLPINYLSNVSLRISNNLIWQYLGIFNTSNNKTNGFASLLNNYLGSCSYVGGYCYIPLIFNSTSSGILGYSDVYVTNNGFLENSQSYNPTTYGTTIENFSINITYDSSYYSIATASLVYNGTAYPADSSLIGNRAIFSKSIIIPGFGLNSNVSFYWSILLVNSTASTYYNSSTSYQYVYPIVLSSCSSSGTNLTFNFTDYDEQNLTRINPFIFQGTFNIWAGDGSIYNNFSINNITANEVLLCLNVNKTVYANAIIQYTDSAGNYVSRNYYLLNATLNNVTQNINLYSLIKSAPASTFIMNVFDENVLPDPNVYIYTMRYYPGENIYRTVQIGKTDAQGQTVGFFQQEIPDYKFLLIKDGAVLLETTGQKVVAQVTPYTLNFNLGNHITPPWEIFQTAPNIQYSLDFNKSTNIISFSYIDTSGLLHYSRLYVQRTNYTGNNIILCDVNSTASAATLTCNMTGYNGNFQATAYISRSPELPLKVITFTLDSLSGLLGNLGTFLGWLIIIACAMSGIYNPTVGIVLTDCAVIFVQVVGLINFGWIFVIGAIAISIFLIAEMNT